MQELNLINTITEALQGKRLDSALAILHPEYSREKLKSWILAGDITVNDKILKPKDKVRGGETIKLKTIIQPITTWQAENIPINIIHEDEDIIIVNKTSNLVVHPGAGNQNGTLVNALLYHEPALEKLPRAGIVHRIDKDTTGLLVIAKNLTAHTSLVKQLQNKSVHRIYEAVVSGLIVTGSTIIQPIDRHPKDRIKMAVVKNGKEAITHYRVLNKFENNTHLRIQLETGRTHQIRVHMAYNKTPIIGDKTYSRNKIPKNLTHDAREYISTFKRQALHAKELGFIHPNTKQFVKWETDLPTDMQILLKHLNSTVLSN